MAFKLTFQQIGDTLWDYVVKLNTIRYLKKPWAKASNCYILKSQAVAKTINSNPTIIISSSETDMSVEKTLLVNARCPVRIMLEYIRKKCQLGCYAQFDLTDENGVLKGLFKLPTYAYATDMFEHKKTYYVIVIRQESDKRISVLPQLNHDNPIYQELQSKTRRYLLTGESSPQTTTPPQGKVTPPNAVKAPIKKK